MSLSFQIKKSKLREFKNSANHITISVNFICTWRRLGLSPHMKVFELVDLKVDELGLRGEFYQTLTNVNQVNLSLTNRSSCKSELTFP